MNAPPRACSVPPCPVPHEESRDRIGAAHGTSVASSVSVTPYRLLAVAGATFFTAIGVVIGARSAGPPSAPAEQVMLLPPPPAPAQAAPLAGHAEQPIDTSITPPPPARHAAAPPRPRATETKLDDIHRVRTPSDDDLPKWVPIRGRLTVVDAADLAENLGLVPAGSTAKSTERIAVAEKLATSSATQIPPKPSDPIVRGVNWNLSSRRPSRFARR